MQFHPRRWEGSEWTGGGGGGNAEVVREEQEWMDGFGAEREERFVTR